MLIGNGGALYVAGAALCGAASSLYMLIPGWFLLGIGIGFVNQVSKFWYYLYQKNTFGTCVLYMCADLIFNWAKEINFHALFLT